MSHNAPVGLVFAFPTDAKKIALPHNLLYKLVIGRNAPLVQLHRNAPVPVAPFVFQKYFSYNFFQGSVLFWLIHLFQGVIIGAPGYPCQRQQVGQFVFPP